MKIVSKAMLDKPLCWWGSFSQFTFSIVRCLHPPPLVLDVITWRVWANGTWMDETWPSALLKHQYKVTGGLWPLCFCVGPVRREWPTQGFYSSRDSKWKNWRCRTQAHNSRSGSEYVLLSCWSYNCSLFQQRLIQNHFCLRILWCWKSLYRFNDFPSFINIDIYMYMCIYIWSL